MSAFHTPEQKARYALAAREKRARQRVRQQKIEWRPIETAPANTQVLIYCPWVKKVAFGRYTTDRHPCGWRAKFSASDGPMHIYGTPSHWMPIPNGPV